MRVEEPHQLWHLPATLPHRLHLEHSSWRSGGSFSGPKVAHAVVATLARRTMQCALEVACMHQTVCGYAAGRTCRGSERGLLWVYRCRGSKSCVARTGRVYMVTLGMRDHGCRPCAVCVGGARPQRRACGWGAQRNASAQGFSLSHRKTRSGVEWSPPHQVAHDMRATEGYSGQLRATQGYSGLLRAANTNKLGNRKVKLSKPYNFPLGACGGSPSGEYGYWICQKLAE